MDAKYACKSPEHTIARRQFMGSLAAIGASACAGGLGIFSTPAIAEQLRSDQKRIVVFNMAGGVGHLASWRPKPGTATVHSVPTISTPLPRPHNPCPPTTHPN